MSQAACPPRYPWFDMVKMSGAEGRRWVSEYARVQPLAASVLAPLDLLRRGQVAAGAEMLARAAESVDRLEVEHASLAALMDRWYLGVAGYAHYVRDEHDQADACMRRAVERLADAVTEHPFLMPMADDAFELTMHRARIARNRRRWKEMWLHLDTGVALREERRAYADMRDGTPLMLSTITRWFDALPVPAEAQPVAPQLQDPAERRRNTEGSVRGIVRLSGFTVPFA